MNDAEIRGVLAGSLTKRKRRERAGPRRRRTAGRGGKDKGRAAEVEVRDLWRSHGWPKARRQPGSGAWRPHGAGDVPPLPADVGGCDPWGPIEVKWQLGSEVWPRRVRGEAYVAPGGWQGEAFVAGVLRELAQLAARIAIDVRPVLFVRGPKPRGGRVIDAYRVYVREVDYRAALGAAGGDAGVWVECSGWFFFAYVAGSPS